VQFLLIIRSKTTNLRRKGKLCVRHDRGHSVYNTWYYLEAQPKTDDENEPYISTFLRHKGGSAVKLIFTIQVRSIKKKGNNLTMMGEESQGKSQLLLCHDVLELDPAKGFLVNGALLVKVDIQVYTNAPLIYTPQK
jgi:hypothetical protein